ncbi:MAG TPA: FmdB family zinc ribbon protein [Candidatus Acidoferrales bacterium]|nr:FmdB family zinc ribbon protein [Candidatus Acidoferrales bacterium]
MPIYEYLCEECGTRYERVVFSERLTIACPKCASERQTLQPSVFRTSKFASPDGSSSSAGRCGCTPKTCGCH